MVRQREFDEDAALDAAMRLFWEKGYEAASLTELTARMGIQRPSMYAAFGSKKELFEAALRSYTQAHAARVRAKLQSRTSVKDAFCALFEGIVADEYEGSLNRGCFSINTMVELAPHDEKFEILTREHQLYLSVIFQETIERGIRAGELDAALEARGTAQVLLVSLIGLTVMLKSRPDRQFADNTVKTVLTLLR
ncbi:TetR/AcrR family transcriptional regulator [Paenibacillus chitinolyticus]|uniref:TetR/AcrR family transcriptional regulator n=1 Tax=Paenibacillus chitinolyticus TaxID=79263 RepID=UPI001C47652A|nr:TetR/AcrR family transcriptional regulator [Paenibacillus chitinolyticus]MBV6713848.1 TetR/AcrR family transcriptional regulator [Paenibacillus chitinolyticus]